MFADEMGQGSGVMKVSFMQYSMVLLTTGIVSHTGASESISESHCMCVGLSVCWTCKVISASAAGAYCIVLIYHQLVPIALYLYITSISPDRIPAAGNIHE